MTPPPSRWLLVCTLLLSALLGFGKRAHELRIGGEGGHKHREALGDDNPEALRVLLWVLGIATMSDLAYTRTQHTNELFGGGQLVFTVPFAAFGIYRFIRLVNRTDTADSPTDSMLRDPAFVVNLVLYAAAVIAIVSYFAPTWQPLTRSRSARGRLGAAMLPAPIALLSVVPPGAVRAAHAPSPPAGALRRHARATVRPAAGRLREIHAGPTAWR